MVSRTAPDRGTRLFVVALVFALFASLIQLVSMAPARALAGDLGPAEVPGSSTAGLQDEDAQWDTKNQHRSWLVEGRWDAVLPMKSVANGGVATVESAWWIVGQAIPEAPGNLPAPKVEVSSSASDRPDIFWDDAANTLYVLMSGGATSSLYVYSYNDGTDAYTLVRASDIPDFEAANSRAAIFKDSNGDLWASKMDEGGLMVSRSTDDGQIWSNPANLIFPVAEGQTQITQVGSSLAVAAAEDGDGGNEAGRFSKYLFYTLPLASANNFANNVFATGTLNIPTLPLAGEAVRVGERVYRFVDVIALPNDVIIGGNPRQNLIDAVNGDGTPGVQYHIDTLPNAEAFAGDPVGTTIPFTAKASGPDGNVVATTTNVTGGSWAAATLTGGASAWTREDVPLVQGSATTVAVVHADDELSLVKDGSDTIYMVTETQRTGNNTQHTLDPQVILYRRTSAGVWSQINVKMDQQSSVGDRKRPVVGILGTSLYIVSIDNSRTESSYWTKPLAALAGAWGTPLRLFKTDFEAYRNNILPRDPVTNSADLLPVLVDWANEDPSQDATIWQTSLPNSGNQAPAVSAGVDKTVDRTPAAALGGVVTDGIDSVAGDTPITSLWTVVSAPVGANVVFRQTSSPTSAVRPDLPGAYLHVNMNGDYVLKLTATEAGTNPLTNSDTVTVHVLPVNTAPSLAVTEPDGGETFSVGQAVTFSATATDPEDGDISAAIVWTSNRQGVIGHGGFFTKSNLVSGSHIIKATVSDGQNVVNSTNRTITIGSSTPPPPPPPPPPDPNNPFIDDDGHIFENAIEWLKAEGITQGCNPPTNNRFCPDDRVTRGQMAAFLVRALGYTAGGSTNYFTDDNGHVFETAINRLRTAGVTQGCNPPANTRFCPDDFVTRGQMAAFLVRALGYTAGGNTNYFIDDNGHVFETAINRLRTAGVTQGCNPPTNNRFCPNDFVTRGQMAAFLKRALDT